MSNQSNNNNQPKTTPTPTTQDTSTLSPLTVMLTEGADISSVAGDLSAYKYFQEKE